MVSCRSPVRHSFVRRLFQRLPGSLLTDERGATLVITALGMVMMLGMVALAVDLGMLLTARTESQRTADSAALAGAGWLIVAPGDEAGARAKAKEYADKNQVHGAVTPVLDEDIDVILDSSKVRVRVRNVTARGNAIGTIFANVLGFSEMNVGTVAAAWGAPAGRYRGGGCILPLALPDRWEDSDPFNRLFDGEPPDWYEPFDPVVYEASAAGSYTLWNEFTGFYDGDHGTLIEIKTQQSKKEFEDPDYEASPCVQHPSWRCWFQPLATDGAALPDSVGGVDALRPWIPSCPEVGSILGYDEELEIVPGVTQLYNSSGAGNEQTLVHQEFKDLIDLHGPLVWGAEVGGPACSVDPFAPGTCIENTPLHRSVPLIDPESVEDTGAGLHATVSALACVFVEKVAECPTCSHGAGAPGRWNTYVRVITCPGEEAVEGDGLFPKVLQLIE